MARLPEVARLSERGLSFVPHAPRQVGKTTALLNLGKGLTLRNFTRDEVAALYAQHTAETGQVFLPEAVDRAFLLTQGQPWLVNALARQLTEVLVEDRSVPSRRRRWTRRRRSSSGGRTRTSTA